MKKARFLKAILAVCVIASCLCGLVACQGGNSANGGTGGTAATVDEVSISEDQVTTTIQNVRAQSNLEDEEAWGTFLVSNNMTPQSIREQMINSLVDQELVKKGAAELQITVDSSEVDTYVESMKANFDNDEAWKQALSQAGFSEESYRENIQTSLMQQAITKHFEELAKVEDSDVLDAAKTYAPYYDGAKRSSHILIGVDDVNDNKAMEKARKKAQEILDRIKSGEISFEDAAKENSTDTGSAEKGGDVGWDVLNSFVTEYTDALEGLDKGDISDPVDSQYGVHIITVTDTYKAPKEVKSIKDLPEDFRDTVKDYAKSVKANADYTKWLEGLREAAKIEINDMPENVPYNIDLTKYQDAAASASAESADASGESAEGDDVEVQVEEEPASGESASAEAASGESASAEAASSASAEAASSDAAASNEAAASDASASAQSASASSESAAS